MTDVPSVVPDEERCAYTLTVSDKNGLLRCVLPLGHEEAHFFRTSGLGLSWVRVFDD